MVDMVNILVDCQAKLAHINVRKARVVQRNAPCSADAIPVRSGRIDFGGRGRGPRSFSTQSFVFENAVLSDFERYPVNDHRWEAAISQQMRSFMTCQPRSHVCI